jgi:hypothetical protein
MPSQAALLFEARMRGHKTMQSTMLSLLSPEQRAPPKHPLGAINAMAD